MRYLTDTGLADAQHEYQATCCTTRGGVQITPLNQATTSLA